MAKLKLIIFMLLICVILLSACENLDLSKVSNEDIERISKNVITCNEPYIRFGSGCCLDQNNNKICDEDESTSKNDDAESDEKIVLDELDETVYEEREFNCESFTLSNCPKGCVTACIPSSCSGNICTADCGDVAGSCIAPSKTQESIGVSPSIITFVSAYSGSKITKTFKVINTKDKEQTVKFSSSGALSEYIKIRDSSNNAVVLTKTIQANSEKQFIVEYDLPCDLQIQNYSGNINILDTSLNLATNSIYELEVVGQEQDCKISEVILPKLWETDKLSKISVMFFNKEKIDFNAYLNGEVFKDGSLSDIIKTDEVLIRSGQIETLDLYYKPTSSGSYIMKIKVIYAGKEATLDNIIFSPDDVPDDGMVDGGDAIEGNTVPPETESSNSSSSGGGSCTVQGQSCIGHAECCDGMLCCLSKNYTCNYTC